MRPHCTRLEAGFTLIELLVAASIATLLGAVTCWLVVHARTTIDVSRERVDVQQRSRVALEAVARAIRDAGAGAEREPAIGSLIQWMPPVWPGRADGSAPSDAITTVRVLTTAHPAMLAADAPQDTTALAFERSSGCTLPCGFSDDTTVVVVDGTGDFDFFALTTTDGVTAIVRRLNGGTDASYGRGAAVLAIELKTYYWQEASREIRADDGDRGDFPVVNDVVGIGFEYFGDPSPPGTPRPVPGEENCLYDSSGALRSTLPTLARAGGTLAPLSGTLFGDGPWCGTGGSPFDADLLRIRGVRIRLRLQAANAAYRGADTRWFLNPGNASDPSRFVKDVVIQTTITPRNLGGWR